MKPFGPNSATALIEEDDDSGYGLNLRIAAQLMAGDDYVPVRYHDRSSGTGKYSVGVRKRQFEPAPGGAPGLAAYSVHPTARQLARQRWHTRHGGRR